MQALFACWQSVHLLVQYHVGLTSSCLKLKLSLQPELMINNDLLRVYLKNKKNDSTAVCSLAQAVCGPGLFFITQRTGQAIYPHHPDQITLPALKPHGVSPPTLFFPKPYSCRGGPLFRHTWWENTQAPHQHVLQLLHKHTYRDTHTLHFCFWFPVFNSLNCEFSLNWMWDHSSHREPINKGQISFVEILQDITLMIFEFAGGQKASFDSLIRRLHCMPPTHTLSLSSITLCYKLFRYIHLLNVLHKNGH